MILTTRNHPKNIVKYEIQIEVRDQRLQPMPQQFAVQAASNLLSTLAPGSMLLRQVRRNEPLNFRHQIKRRWAGKKPAHRAAV